jgi:di/tripeptidase
MSATHVQTVPDASEKVGAGRASRSERSPQATPLVPPGTPRHTKRPTKIRTHGARVAAVTTVACAFLLAGCGESSSEKATKQVCSATSEIKTQLKKLETLPISSSFPTEAKASVEAIDKSIKKIEEDAPNLPTARKEEINAADKKFQTEIATITKDVATASKSTNLEAALKSAEPQVKTALSNVSAAYKKAFEELKCS